MVEAGPWAAGMEGMLDTAPGRVDLRKVAACSQPRDHIWHALQVDTALHLVADDP